MAGSTAQAHIMLVMALALAGCKAAAPAPAPRAEPVPVRLVRVGADGGAVTTITGTVRHAEETPLAFAQPGRVRAVLVDVGDTVRAGQLLATLDTGPADANAVAAAEDARRAALDLTRLRTLADKGWVTRARLESAEAGAAAANARAAAARFDQRYARVHAPGPGVVLARTLDPGAIAAAGAPVLTLGDARGGLVVQLPLTDRQAAALRPGTPAELRLPALGPAPISGQLRRISGRGDPATGAFIGEIALPALPGLRSGMIGTVRIATGSIGGETAASRPVIPATAIFAARTEEAFVYVHDPRAGRVRARLVRIEAIGEAGITLSAGLKAGEAIVATGLDRLRDGAQVRVIR
jgi:membrane fusion protein (multidrug efflux system)